MLKRYLPLLVLVAALTLGVAPPAIDGFSHVESLGGIDEYRLDANGLQVLLMPMPSSPVLTFVVTYRVGSRNEVTGTTGATHLLEHLMFNGTHERNKENGNGVDQLLERTGATYSATTWPDRTNYYETVGNEHFEMVVAMEADRMRNLRLREEDRRPEMTVVRNEFERAENSPFQALIKEILQGAYVAHPYHHNVMGWRSDIEKMPIEKIRAFYETYYWPDRATVTVVGDFTHEQALGLIKKYYGPIPKAPHPFPEVYTEEPEQTGPRHVTMKRGGQLGIVAVGYKSAAGLHDDFATLQVLTRILTDGQNSRLSRALTDKGLTTRVDAFNGYFKDPSMCIFFAYLGPGATHEETEKVLVEQIEKLKTDGVSREETDAAVAKLLSGIAFDRDGSSAIAVQISDDIAVGHWTNYVRLPEKYRKVTPDMVRSVANKYLNIDQSTTGWFVPILPNGAAARRAAVQPPRAAGPVSHRHDDEPAAALAARAADAAGRSAATSATIADGVVRTSIDGIDVIAYRTGVHDVVYLRGALPAGDITSPADNPMIAALVGGMLDRGTTKHGKFEIAQQLDAAGASIAFAVSNYTTEFTARCLKKDVPLVISLLAEQLRLPAFSGEELGKLKKQLAGDLLRQLESTDLRASDEFARAAYPAGHPNRRPGVPDLLAALEKATVDDLKRFHAAHYGPASFTVVAAGDIDVAQVQGELGKAFAGWSGGAPPPAAAPATSTATPRERTIAMPDKTSVSIVIGQATGLRYGEPEYLALRLGTSVLGGSGFAGRLMKNVREKQGLTYGIHADLTSDTFTDGDWRITATFAPALLDKGIESTVRELTAWHQQGITEKELADHKGNVAGSFKISLATTGGLSQALLTAVNCGRDVTWLDEFPARVNALTLEEVNAAIKKYVDPGQMFLIKAGTMPTPTGP